MSNLLHLANVSTRASTTQVTPTTGDPYEIAVPLSSVPVFAILAAITIAGNVLVLVAIQKDPFNELRTISNHLVLNLAVSDLVVGVVSEPLMSLVHWYGSTMYRAAFTTMYAALCSSCLTILALTVERYIVLEYPLSSWRYLNPVYIKLCTGAIWVVSIVLSLLPIMFWKSKQSYEVFMSDAVGITTMIIMFGLYWRIFIIIHRCYKRGLGPTIEDSTSSTQDNSRGENQPLLQNNETEERIRQREKKVAKAIFLFVGVFAICWVPCFVAQNLLFFCEKEGCITQQYANYANFFGLLNSALNPGLYALESRKFRRAVCHICACDGYRRRRVVIR